MLIFSNMAQFWKSPFSKLFTNVLYPFGGIKVTFFFFFFSNWQNRAIKWKNSSYLTLSRLAPCSSGALWWSGQYQQNPQGAVTLSRSQQPMTSGDLKWKRRVGLKISHMLNASAVATWGIHLIKHTYSSLQSPEYPWCEGILKH